MSFHSIVLWFYLRQKLPGGTSHWIQWDEWDFWIRLQIILNSSTLISLAESSVFSILGVSCAALSIYSTVLKAVMLPGTAGPNWLPLHPVTMWQPLEFSLGERNFYPFPLGKAQSRATGLLKSTPAILLAQKAQHSLGSGGVDLCCPTIALLPIFLHPVPPTPCLLPPKLFLGGHPMVHLYHQSWQIQDWALHLRHS